MDYVSSSDLDPSEWPLTCQIRDQIETDLYLSARSVQEVRANGGDADAMLMRYISECVTALREAVLQVAHHVDNLVNELVDELQRRPPTEPPAADKREDDS
jgi:hypothetical protein